MNNKLLATIKSTSGTKDGVGSFEAVLSMPTVDRDNEVIDARAFDPLPDHITIDIDHAMTVEKTVGSGTPYYDEAGILRFKGTYASHPLAQMVRGLVDEKHIRTMSVAFMPGGEWEFDQKDGKNHLRKGELLNAGIVGIPSNREALITASKSLVTEVIESTAATVKAGARNSTQDLSLLQSAHDALSALGAACETKTPSTDGEPTDTNEKAAEAADVKSPAEPAGPSVEVDRAKARLLLAQVALT